MTPQEAFRVAQSHLLAEGGTRARSLAVDLRSPAMGVHVLEAGAGPAVVMIHGGNSVAVGWEPLLSLLQDDIHMYAPDRPGCGLTDRVDYRRVPSFRAHCIAFLDSLLDALGLGRVSLVGNSIGGWWSLAYALARPERIDRIVCVGEPAASAPRVQLRHSLLASPAVSALLYATVLKPRRGRTRRQLGTVVAHPERISEAFLDVAYAAAILPGARIAWTSMVQHFVRWRSAPDGTYAMREQLCGLPHPILLVWGERDPCSPRWGRELCGYLPNARLEVLPGAGHMPWIDEPRRTAALIRAFLRPRNDGAEPSGRPVQRAPI